MAQPFVPPREHEVQFGLVWVYQQQHSGLLGIRPWSQRVHAFWR
jgi:hypothetical protein